MEQTESHTVSIDMKEINPEFARQFSLYFFLSDFIPRQVRLMFSKNLENVLAEGGKVFYSAYSLNGPVKLQLVNEKNNTVLTITSNLVEKVLDGKYSLTLEKNGKNTEEFRFQFILGVPCDKFWYLQNFEKETYLITGTFDKEYNKDAKHYVFSYLGSNITVEQLIESLPMDKIISIGNSPFFNNYYKMEEIDLELNSSSFEKKNTKCIYYVNKFCNTFDVFDYNGEIIIHGSFTTRKNLKEQIQNEWKEFIKIVNQEKKGASPYYLHVCKWPDHEFPGELVVDRYGYYLSEGHLFSNKKIEYIKY